MMSEESPVADSPAIPPTVARLSLVSLLNDLASEMVYPLLPAFLTITLGGGAIALGLLDGAADLVSGTLRWVSGRLADRPRWRHPLIAVGYALAVVVRPVMAVAGAAWQVVTLRVLDRLGKGLRSPARDALIAEVTPLPIRGRAYGFHRAADHLGAVAGSLVAWGLLTAGFSVPRVILWSALPGLLVLLALVAALRSAGRSRAARDRVMENLGRSVPDAHAENADAVGRAFWGPVALLVLLLSARIPETLLLLRLQDLGLGVVLVPLVWAALHVVRSAASYPGGGLSDRFGPRRLMAVGGGLLLVVLVAYGEVGTPAAGVGVFLALGVVTGLTEGAEKALIASLVPVRTGRGFGAYQGAAALAALPLGLGYGLLYQRHGGSVAILVSAGVAALATLLWAWPSRRA